MEPITQVTSACEAVGLEVLRVDAVRLTVTVWPATTESDGLDMVNELDMVQRLGLLGPIQRGMPHPDG